MNNNIITEVKSLQNRFKTSNPYEIIDGLGINLFPKSGLGGLSGFYYVTHHQRYIVINTDLSEQEQKLVAAHELGHDRLHQHLAKVSPLKDMNFYNMTARTEYQANMFASELLISDKTIESYMLEEMDYLTMCRELELRPEIVTFKLYSMMQRGYSINMPENINSKFLKKKYS